MFRRSSVSFRFPPSLISTYLPPLRSYKAAPTTLTEKKKRERMQRHLTKEKQIKDEALSQQQQLIEFQQLTDEMPPYVMKACFIPSLFQLLICGSVYLNYDFFTPANTNSIVAMAHLFAQNILVFSGAIVGYEATRTAIPEHALAQKRYKPEVKLDVPFEKQGRGLQIRKSGGLFAAYSIVLCGTAIAMIDGLSPLATLPLFLNGFLLKYYSYRQAEFGLLPFWVVSTMKLNSLFLVVQVFLLFFMILARMYWVMRMEDQKISLEFKIEEKLEGRALSQEEKKEIERRKDSTLNQWRGPSNLWK